MKNSFNASLAILAVASSLGISSALAETMKLKSDLAGASEVPANASAGKGTMTAVYDTATKKLEWKGSVSGLSGAATAAHFHGPAEAGKNAGVLVPAPIGPSGAFEGSATLTDDQAKALSSGQVYFNIHTAANPNGEVRGQVMKAN